MSWFLDTVRKSLMFSYQALSCINYQWKQSDEIVQL